MSTRRRIIALAALVALAAPSGAVAAAAPTSVDGAAAIALLNQQRAANNIPPLTDQQPFATAWCPNEINGPSGGELERDLSANTEWSATTSPWDLAPLHQQDLYNPLYTQAGDANVSGQACFGAGTPAAQPASPTYDDFISESGNGSVPIDETIETEDPFSPQQAAGIRLGFTTGPQIILYALGFPQESNFAGGSMRAVAWTLSTAAGVVVPEVRMVDEAVGSRYGYPGYVDGDVVYLIPPVLLPGTSYVGTLEWAGPTGTTATQHFSFKTAGSTSYVSLLNAVNRLSIVKGVVKASVTCHVSPKCVGSAQLTIGTRKIAKVPVNIPFNKSVKLSFPVTHFHIPKRLTITAAATVSVTVRGAARVTRTLGIQY